MAKATNSRTTKPAPRHLTLSPAQIEALEEMCTLIAYTTGFSYPPAMERVCKAIADKAGEGAKLAYLARASKREHLELMA